ncbi:hypothetical protein EYR41_004434 [Orbilia oligospora]|uniref:Uncharacterized protein n=1 Tax=Orbilia oligospora TaxID=2813651 RepID=A0A7C8P469_ORBOL|nr:hypothetical protein TWF706_005803 [Orbilia oligospora]KAF3159259.1 hypothetical protein TWF751_001050 [Orbilia oligospora]TGJ72546.1 hypothetical protein EYR41_004434 [Orbilia oligospora]
MHAVCLSFQGGIVSYPFAISGPVKVSCMCPSISSSPLTRETHPYALLINTAVATALSRAPWPLVCMLTFATDEIPRPQTTKLTNQRLQPTNQPNQINLSFLSLLTNYDISNLAGLPFDC